MKVSIVIPSYNRGEILADTVRMALAQHYHDYEVIVVDQSPSPSLSLQDGRLRILHRTQPNLPAARNAGVLAARGEIIVFLDDDVVFPPDYVSLHVRHYDDPSVGGVMGFTLPPDDTNEEELFAWRCAHYGAEGPVTNGRVAVSRAIGGNTSYRRSLLFEAGLSDERYGGSGWYEDIDLSIRVRHHGHRLIFDSGIRLLHLALPSGGCQNRDPKLQGQREFEHVRYFCYFNLKNRNILGYSEVSKSLWRTYREYALNQSVIRAGVRHTLTRQVSYFKGLAQALWWSATPATLPPISDAAPITGVIFGTQTH
jgi:glycosyltransferase involved in cell wall biosynthesis